MKKTLQNYFLLKKSHNIFKTTLFLLLFFGLKNVAFSQTSGSVGIGTTAPYANAVLDVTSTTKGVLFPRLTATQRDVLTPLLNITANGLFIYNVTTLRFNYWDGVKWNDVGLAGATGAAGADGTIWYADQGVPSNTLGKSSDFYLDGITGDVYKKDITNVWIRFGGSNPVNLKNINKREVLLPSFSLAANGATIQTLAFTGALVGNPVAFSPNTALPDGAIISYARVSAAGTIEVKFYNVTGSIITIPTSNFEIAVF